MPEIGSPIPAAAIEVLWELADRLIPPGRGMPAASSVDDGANWIRHALSVRPDLTPAIRRVATWVQGADDHDQHRLISELRDLDPGCFRDFATLVVSAYYMSPVIRQLTGYPGAQPPPGGDDDFGKDLLGLVQSRRPRYRDTPD
jgi:hypothetical protein